MAAYRLSNLAKEDLVNIWKFIARENRVAASQSVQRFINTFQMLTRQPLIGEVRDELKSGLRAFSLGRYVIFYRVSSSDRVAIEIIRIIHEARDLRQHF